MIYMILLAVLLPTVILFCDFKSKRNKKYENTITTSAAFTAAGWICYALSLLLFTLESEGEREILLKVLALIFASAAFILLIHSYRLQIYYDTSGFALKKFFIVRQYRYEDIECMTKKAFGRWTLSIKGKKTFLSETIPGTKEFIKFARKQHFILKGYSIKEIKKPLINDGVLNYFETVMFLLFLSVFMTAVAIFQVAKMVGPVSIPRKLIELEGEIISVRDSILDKGFDTREGEIYIPMVPDRSDILNSLSEGSKFKIYIEPWHHNEGADSTESGK